MILITFMNRPFTLRPRQTCQTLSNILSKCLTMFDGMFDVRIATSSNIIDKIRKLQTKIAAKEVAMVVILSELADSDDEKPTRGPTRSWIKRRKENGFFETIISTVNSF